ncbi:hypothetical protein LMG23994_05017 [Cupriavidus pinatubonensis]|uniref:Uncharacterized protein n=1 Tax=Cupriavidus pinatubonensis TaxID=248026 RepID=A0ABN7ZF63_9BURK|nr:hypothetical protein LMG23994_05017 [Cupriavidus pinatubonensis]
MPDVSDKASLLHLRETQNVMRAVTLMLRGSPGCR